MSSNPVTALLPPAHPGKALTTDPADASQHPEHPLPPTPASLQQRVTTPGMPRTDSTRRIGMACNRCRVSGAPCAEFPVLVYNAVGRYRAANLLLSSAVKGGYRLCCQSGQVRPPSPAPRLGLAHGFGRRQVPARAGRRRAGAPGTVPTAQPPCFGPAPEGEDHVSAFEHLPLISLSVRRLDHAG
jgi:hypothetical protein